MTGDVLNRASPFCMVRHALKHVWVGPRGEPERGRPEACISFSQKRAEDRREKLKNLSPKPGVRVHVLPARSFRSTDPKSFPRCKERITGLRIWVISGKRRRIFVLENMNEI